MFFANISFAQIPEIIETDPSTIYWENQSTVDLQQLNIIRALDYSSVDFHLKIYLHVLRRADGSGGQSVDNVNRMLQILYEDFDPLGINFVNRYNSINYIDNDLYYVDPLTYYPTIFNTYSHTNGIDIYLMI